MVRARFQIICLIVLHVAHVWAQSTHIPVPKPKPDDDQWSFVASGYGSIVPDDQSYFTPMFSADHKWLHLEVRYDYEDLRTASMWAGYNFHFGEQLTLAATPMFGVVFGRTNAVAPGYEISLTWKRLNLSSQAEYVANPREPGEQFFLQLGRACLLPQRLVSCWLRVATHAGLPRARRFTTGWFVWNRAREVGFHDLCL